MEIALMRVGLMADTHDRVPAVAQLLERMTSAGVSLVMHAGDYCSPFSLAPFRAANVPLLGVFGRNDGDREGISAYATRGMGVEIYQSPHSFEVGGHEILIVHDLAEISSRSVNKHSFVIFGCSHRQETITHGDTMLVNPGEACGWLYGACTGAILDLAARSVEVITL